MTMGVEYCRQLEFQFTEQCQIAFELFEYGVDDHRRARTTITEHVGISR